MAAFAKALPRMRRRIDRDLGQRGLTREKALAAIVRLLETTFIRIGNEEYARDNQSFGLTTLRCGQVRVRGSRLKFEFRASGASLVPILGSPSPHADVAIPANRIPAARRLLHTRLQSLLNFVRSKL